jgi:hypothetical protein
MCFRIKDWDSETHETRKDCDKVLAKSLSVVGKRPPLPGCIPIPPATQIRVRDSYRRIGIVFYAQQQRHFTQRRREALILGLEELEPSSGALEQGLRWRVHRLARPRMWERLKFCLDKWGGYHPEWAATFRRVRREWRGTDMEVWLEPHPIEATRRRMEEAGLL